MIRATRSSWTRSSTGADARTARPARPPPDLSPEPRREEGHREGRAEQGPDREHEREREPGDPLAGGAHRGPPPDQPGLVAESGRPLGAEQALEGLRPAR